MASSPKQSPDREIVKMFEAAGVVDYLQYLQSDKKILLTNFKAGVAKGFGITIGMTVVLGIFIWLLTKLIALPVIGEYFEQAERFIQEYSENTNYSDELNEMVRLLDEINGKMKQGQ